MEKPLQIVFRDTDSSAYLEDFIYERVDRLDRFHSHIISCRIVVEVPHRSAEGAKPPIVIVVEVEIPNRSTLVARAEGERRDVKGGELSAMVNRAFDAIRRQLEETADIQTGRVKNHGANCEAGVVMRLFAEQNYGFIEVKGAPDLYFTRNAVIGGSFDDLAVGTMVHVTRATTEGPMGPQASSVRLVDAGRSAA
jgi:ribosome-associated translation inhibitor RaiA